MEPTSPLKIFLVDDEIYCLHLYAQYLNNLGYSRIHYFHKSTECLDQLVVRPDLIFLDYHMDNLNGIDILKKIKRFDPNIPVVFISGQEDINVAVNSLKYGALDYIIKENLNEEKIKGCLEKVLEVRNLLSRKSKFGKVKRMLSGIGVLSAAFFLQKLFSKI